MRVVGDPLDAAVQYRHAEQRRLGVTASGLIFIAAATDNLIRAIDIRSGKTVWSDVLPGGGQANPMIYEQGGKEYLVIMAGGHHFMKTPQSDALVAYALPGRS